MQTIARAVLGILCALPLAAQTPAEPEMPSGPSATRDLFPFNFMALVYQPAAPDTLPPGRMEVSLGHWRGNVLEFSDSIKTALPQDSEGRLIPNRAVAEAFAAEHPDLPMAFFFDGEVQRSTLRIRRGLTQRDEAWLELSALTFSGGSLDGFIEAFHKAGNFQQAGRTSLERNQLSMIIMQSGKVVLYHDQNIPTRMQDPVLGWTHAFVKHPGFSFSLDVQLKPALARPIEAYRSGWDSALQLTGRWSASGQDFYFGAGYVHRESGSDLFNALSVRDIVGAHLGWEGRSGRTIRPFVQLYALSGGFGKQPEQKLDRPSLQHDVGFRWRFGKDLTLGFHYMNNITHNENTADVAFGLDLTWRSSSR